jgi:hypothetical protein
VIGFLSVAISNLVPGVRVWVCFEPSFPGKRYFDLPDGHHPLFSQTMGEYDGRSPVVEMEQPIVKTLEANSQIVDAVSQVIRLRATNLVTDLLQPLQSLNALDLGLPQKTG